MFKILAAKTHRFPHSERRERQDLEELDSQIEQVVDACRGDSRSALLDLCASVGTTV
jgi:hypothetical protein